MLSPRSLSGWLRSTVNANFLFGSWGWIGVQMSEQANHRALLILLGTELYRRDNGNDPPTPEAPDWSSLSRACLTEWTMGGSRQGHGPESR